MIDALEDRRLFAASAVQDGNTLRVLGTDESETIRIFTGVQQSSTDKNRLTTYYSVLVNDEQIGRFGESVQRIYIFGLGGRDRITGAVTPSSAFIDPRNGMPLTDYPRRSVYPAPTYIEGGSGNDVIVGGLANDTLKGGRGDDRLVDENGRNYIDGNAGDDMIYVNDGVASGGLGQGSPAAAGTQDTVLSEAGRDTVYRDERDTLKFGSGRTIQTILDDSSGVIVTTSPFGIE